MRKNKPAYIMEFAYQKVSHKIECPLCSGVAHRESHKEFVTYKGRCVDVINKHSNRFFCDSCVLATTVYTDSQGEELI